MPSELLVQLLIIVAMMGIFYAIVLIPERKRKKKYKETLDSLSVNDKVVTRGGLVGKVINVTEDEVVLESGPDRVRLRFTKQAISTVVSKKEDKETKKEDKEAKKEDK
ncbi:preprotein translocase subunit YajC [Inconstantimicrobium mannanitabidum]|uniref:Uncharacterized protein n=1 Tax=Inconstantimicrobium mannanitabidum TaxID=1604901 RepID=A0ACB5RA20_9CLOT|nr:preprotein translocase subunit YajC [Clostridium sp. TW13]GKX66033.1 hypothetical protein rsdtw13_12910 [Clostridium sp. TW13]